MNPEKQCRRGMKCPLRQRFYGARPPDLSLREGRRGALSAKREEVPLGCNLAVPDWMTGRLLREIPTSLRASE